MKRFMLVLLAVLSLVFLVGTIGAFDANNIGFGQCFLQSIIAIAVDYLALYALSKK